MYNISTTPHPSVNSWIDKIVWFCFTSVVVLGFTDISGDYPLAGGIPYRNLMPEISNYVSMVSKCLISFLCIVGIFNFSTGRSTFAPTPAINVFLCLFTMSTVLGVCVGIYNGVELRYVIGDAQNILVYFFVFAVRYADVDETMKSLLRILWIGIGIMFAKLIFSIVSNMVLGLDIGGRYLLKMSTFFAVVLLIVFSRFLNSANRRSRRKYLFLIALVSIGVFLAHMRGMYYGIAIGLLFIIVMSLEIKKNLLRLLLAVMLFSLIGLFFASRMQGGIGNILGDWSGEEFQAGLEYRKQQLEFFLNLFRNNAFFGVGLGWFDPNSEFYPTWAARPYLVELEYPNLLAKLGLVGFSLLTSAFLALLFACINACRWPNNMEQAGVIVGMVASLISLLFSSITNPLYSSVYFHLYVVIVLITISVLKSQRTLIKKQLRKNVRAITIKDLRSSQYES